MSKISAVTQISVENDLDLFEKSIKSVLFADEIIVYTMFEPNNRLKDIIKKYNLITKPVDLDKLKNKIVEEIRHKQVTDNNGDWVLILDYDEVITKDLRSEIENITHSDDHYSAYAILRKNYSLGQHLKRGGWGDDYVVRLIFKQDFILWPTNIHSTPQIKGDISQTTHPMLHYKDPTLEFIVDKTNRYSDTEASQYYDGNLAPVDSFTLIRKTLMEILRRGVFKLGFMDGPVGIIQSIYQGFSVFISYAKLYEKQNK